MLFANEMALTAFAQTFARALRVGDCVALHGDLGAGKSTFARAIIRVLAADFDQALDVPSPTFTLVQHYETEPTAAHMDLYRITDASEIEELGLDAALETGVALIEWPGKVEGYLPAALINVALEEPEGQPDARTMTIDGPPDFLVRLERSAEIERFLAEHDHETAHRTAFFGDASARNYELIFVEGEESPHILMDAPRTPDGPPVYDGLPYSQVVHLAEDVSAFVAISSLLKINGFATPKILAHDMPAGLLLTENLGRGKIVDDNNVPIAERYIVAGQVLADIHNKTWPQQVTLPDGNIHRIPRYDVRAMRTGLSLLPDWWGKENALSVDQKDTFNALWLPHFERFQIGYDDLIIRDYHSPNIIWRGDKSGTDRIGIIDHQDALIGPGAYDVGSLIHDARTVVSPDLQADILSAYCARRTNFDEAQTRRDIATLCAFRASRLLGLWVRLDLRDNKPRFRQYMNQTRTYLKQALHHDGLEDLRAWYVDAGVIDA